MTALPSLATRGFRRAAGLLRPGGFQTPSQRGRERYRRAGLTTITTLAARLISIVTVIVSVPLALPYLGDERFGLWMLLSSLFFVAAFADLGLANGLVTALARADARDDRREAARYVSSAFAALLALALLLGAGFAIALPAVTWADLFNVSSPEARAEVEPALAVLVACVLVSLPLGVVERAQLGFQEGFYNGLWAALAALLGLVVVLVATALEAGVPWLVLGVAGTVPLASLLNGIVLFGRRKPWLLPRLRLVERRAVQTLLGLGALFFVLQWAAAIAFATDNLVVASLFGAAEVTEYAVSWRLFSFLPAFLVILFNPLWPAYGEAIARGDRPWVAATLRRSLVVTLALTGAVAAVLVGVGRPIIDVWTAGAVNPPLSLLLGLGAWMILGSCGNAVAMFLNGASIIRFQALSAVVMATAALVLKIVLGRSFGLPGIIWATVLAYSVFTALPVGLYVKRLFSRGPLAAPGLARLESGARP